MNSADDGWRTLGGERVVAWRGTLRVKKKLLHVKALALRCACFEVEPSASAEVKEASADRALAALPAELELAAWVEAVPSGNDGASKICVPPGLCAVQLVAAAEDGRQRKMLSDLASKLLKKHCAGSVASKGSAAHLYVLPPFSAAYVEHMRPPTSYER